MNCSNKCGKTCHDKSCQRYYNNNAQTIEAGGTTQLVIKGNKVVDSGISIETESQNYTVVKKGLYHISADVVIDGTTAGDVVLTVLMDGVALPCTIRPATLIAGSSTEIHTETDICLASCCCDVNHTFTFVLTSSTGAGTVTNFCSGILKLA